MASGFFALAQKRPKPSPEGKLAKIDSQRRFLTDEGSGRESEELYIYQTYCMSVLHASPHPSSNSPKCGQI